MPHTYTQNKLKCRSKTMPMKTNTYIKTFSKRERKVYGGWGRVLKEMARWLRR